MKRVVYHFAEARNTTRTRANLSYDVTSEMKNEGFRSVVMSGLDINN